MLPKFKDRTQAGQILAEKLLDYAQLEGAMVIGLPRGGVVVAAEIARKLQLPLDACVVRKLGVPSHPELAMGAIGMGGVCWLNQDLIRSLGISSDRIDLVKARELVELERRERVYRGHRPPLDVRDRTVILVDDGLATGATMRAAILVIRGQQPAQTIVAVPVASPDAAAQISQEVDRLVSAISPEPFYAIGHWYQDFEQTTDVSVCQLL
jgi:putative phosphoribosyl transferase